MSDVGVTELRERATAQPRSVEARTALVKGLLADGRFPEALSEVYRAYCLDRRREETVRLLQDVVAGGGLLGALRATVRAIARAAADVPKATDLIAGLDQNARLDLLRVIFETCDPPRVVNLPRDLKRPWTGEVTTLGLDEEALKSFLRDAVRSKSPYPFQLDLLASGRFELRSPVSGEPVVADASLSVCSPAGRPLLYYYVRDREPFFTSVYPHSGHNSAIWMPDRDLLMADAAHQNPRGIAQLKALMVEFGPETAAYLASEQPRRIALLFGAMNHIGHAVLNEFEAFHQCAAEGRFDRVELVQRGWSSFVDHRELFPEIADKPVEVLTTMPEAYRSVLDQNLILVRPTCGAYLMSRGQGDRFIRAGTRYAASHVVPDLDRAKGCDPLIWFEIRTNDRFWLGQGPGIAAITNELARDFPRIGIVLAGWSVPNPEWTTDTDRKAIEADRMLGAEIRKLVDPAIPVFDITGVPTVEKVVWSTVFDVFVTVWSSGIVFPLGIGRRRGVIHSNTSYMKGLIEQGGRLDIIEDCPPMLTVDPAKVTDDPTAKGYATQNHDVDWREIYAVLRGLLDEQRAAAA